MAESITGSDTDTPTEIRRVPRTVRVSGGVRCTLDSRTTRMGVTAPSTPWPLRASHWPRSDVMQRARLWPRRHVA